MDGRTDGRQTVTLRFPLWTDAASERNTNEPKSRFARFWLDLGRRLSGQLTSAAVADVAGSHAATTVVSSTVARQTALRFRHSDEVVTDSGLQSVEPPSAQPFHNWDRRTTPRTTALR